ncbi:MAG: dissimilatory sulfite reductase (desulfoviridin) alpha/beta subunit [Nonlabens sp.]|jgi:dissimilatory sulfite reductase (desulfoviridin) alpha/beta subunit
MITEMNIELIKTELAQRVEQLLITRKAGKRTAIKVVHKVKSWSDKVAETEDLIHKVYHTLHEVLQQNGIHFKNEIEKEGFVSFMEPTVNDLVIKNMAD